MYHAVEAHRFPERRPGNRESSSRKWESQLCWGSGHPQPLFEQFAGDALGKLLNDQNSNDLGRGHIRRRPVGLRFHDNLSHYKIFLEPAEGFG